jgi:uncharacterized protein
LTKQSELINDFTSFKVFGNYYLYSASSLEFGLIDQIAFQQLNKIKKTPLKEIPTTELKSKLVKLLISKKVIDLKRKRNPPLISKSKEYVLRLIPTRSCNLNCTYCFVKDKTNKYDMPIKTAKKAIDYFSNQYGSEETKLQIDLTGVGEILLRIDFIKEINDYVRNIKKKRQIDIFTSLCTNGLQLDEKTSAFFKQNDILFGISIDGDVNLSQVNRKGQSLKKVFQNISNISNNFLGIAATINANNYNIKKIFEEIVNLKNVSTISIKPARLSKNEDGAINLSNLKRIMREYDRFCKWILKKAIKNDYRKLSALFSGEDYFAKFLKDLVGKHRVFYRCSAGISNIAVDYKGDFILCPALYDSEKAILGNLENGINEDKHQKLLNTYADNIKECQDCWARYICAGQCFAEGKLHSKRPEEPYIVSCLLNKHLIKLGVFFWSELSKSNPEMVKHLIEKYC